MTSIALIVGVALLVIILIGAVILVGVVVVGIILKKASEPPYIDSSDYRLSQGRDVGKDQ
ncbi:MAG: hypothetical protein HC893_04560 [Chloroflexaceae bacterium]|nr:hypothetical protein [Chloroflexaceae bacterium]NJL33252.1 hypothetical protein [Chloroflexaceae bacterium]NJO04772.1 hypothetical protein [Chloroflexaceae bacterium]